MLQQKEGCWLRCCFAVVTQNAGNTDEAHINAEGIFDQSMLQVKSPEVEEAQVLAYSLILSPPNDFQKLCWDTSVAGSPPLNQYNLEWGFVYSIVTPVLKGELHADWRTTAGLLLSMLT